MPTKARIRIIFVFIAAGLVFSGYLSAVKLFSGACAFNEGCPYFLGYPACWYGFAMYLIMFIASTLAIINKARTVPALKINVAVSSLGIIFAGSFATQELLQSKITGNLGLSSCVYGLIFYAAILVLSVIALKKTLPSPDARFILDTQDPNIRIDSVKQDNKRIIAFGVVAAAIIIFALWSASFYFSSSSPSASTPANEASSSVVFIIDASGTANRYETSVSQTGENSFVLLQEALAKNNVPFGYKAYPGMGNLVTQIGNIKNGANGKYWQYFVNGNYMTVGADAYIPRPGDTIEWKFMSYSGQ